MGRKKKDLNDRVQAPFRIFAGDYQKLKVKTQTDKITIQKLFDVVIDAYLKDNKEVQKLVSKHSGEKQKRRQRYTLSELESDQILKKLEELSPMKDLETIFEEVKNT